MPSKTSRVASRTGNRLRRVQGAAAGKDRQALEERLLLLSEQIVTPGNRIPHRLLPRRDVAGASREQRQALLQAHEQRLRWKQLDEGRGQFNGQRKAIEPVANLGDGRGVGRGHREVGLHGLRPLDKEAYRIELEHAARAAAGAPDPAAGTAQAGTPARHRCAAARGSSTSTFAPGARARRLVTKDAASRTRSKLSRTSSSRFPPSTPARRSVSPLPSSRTPSTRGDGRGDQGRIVEHTQIDEPDAVRKVLQQIGGGLQGHTGLADTTWPRDGQEPDVITAEEVNNPSNLLLATEKRRQLHGEVVRAQWPDVRIGGKSAGRSG